MSKRGVIIGLCVVAGVAAAGAAWIDHEEKQKLAAWQQRKAEDAISILPPGVEDAWIRYVDERLSMRLEARQNAIRVRYPGESKTVLVSLNMPYSVECSPDLGGSVTFGSGENATAVLIYGFLDFESKEPEMGVRRTSIAAQQLHERLCDRIQSRVATLMKP